MHRFFIFSALILSALGSGLYFVFHELPVSEWQMMVQENGLVEMGTAILFSAAAFLAMIQFIKTTTKMDFIFMMLMALAGAREMDWHKEWTTQSILKSRFYIDPNTPAFEKLIGGLIIAFLIYAAWQLIKRVPQFITGVWHFIPTMWAIGLGLGMVVMAKTLDLMARIMPFMAEFHADNRAFLGVIEETMEFTGAVFFVMLAVMKLKRG